MIDDELRRLKRRVDRLERLLPIEDNSSQSTSVRVQSRDGKLTVCQGCGAWMNEDCVCQLRIYPAMKEDILVDDLSEEDWNLYLSGSEK